jgi:hypothetical protein
MSDKQMDWIEHEAMMTAIEALTDKVAELEADILDVRGAYVQLGVYEFKVNDLEATVKANKIIIDSLSDGDELLKEWRSSIEAKIEELQKDEKLRYNMTVDSVNGNTSKIESIESVLRELLPMLKVILFSEPKYGETHYENYIQAFNKLLEKTVCEAELAKDASDGNKKIRESYPGLDYDLITEPTIKEATKYKTLGTLSDGTLVKYPKKEPTIKEASRDKCKICTVKRHCSEYGNDCGKSKDNCCFQPKEPSPTEDPCGEKDYCTLIRKLKAEFVAALHEIIEIAEGTKDICIVIDLIKNSKFMDAKYSETEDGKEE